MTSPVSLTVVSGAEVLPWIPHLAALRVAVFREFPYLYEGSPDDEQRYLAAYVKASRACLVLARDGDQVVGASSAIAMEEETDEVQAPFLDAGIEPSEIIYFGESILLPAYRGQGIGGRFFDEREAWAANQPGRTLLTFCAVQRPPDHPQRPVAFRPLDGFWRRRGYEERPDLETVFRWRTVGDPEESAHRMRFWTREIGSSRDHLPNGPD